MLKLLQALANFFTGKKASKPVPSVHEAVPIPIPIPTPVPPTPVPTPAVPTAPSKATKTAAWLAIAVVIVAGFEGLYTRPYHDVVGVLTVCYGETAADQVDLKRTYTPAECKEMLARDLPKYDAELRKCIHVQMSPNVEAAVVSLGYNVGTAAVCRGSVAANLNRGDIRAACDSFLRYDRAGGRVIQGLVNRRQAERRLCLKG